MVEREGVSVTEDARGTHRPTLEQGCLLAVGAVALTFGGCLAAAALDSDLLFQLSTIAGGLAALVGLVLLIARFDRWLRRDRERE